MKVKEEQPQGSQSEEKRTEPKGKVENKGAKSQKTELQKREEIMANEGGEMPEPPEGEMETQMGTEQPGGEAMTAEEAEESEKREGAATAKPRKMSGKKSKKMGGKQRVGRSAFKKKGASAGQSSKKKSAKR